MKKLLSAVFLLTMITFYGYSQSLSLSNRQGPVENNSILIQAGTPDSVELITYLNVKNISSSSLSVLCKKTELTLLDSTEVTMCWAGGCYSSGTFISPNDQPIAVGETNTEFIGHYGQTAFHPLTSGESVVRWVFFSRSNANDSVSVTIKYTSYPLGIGESIANRGMLSDGYPNPASGQAGFNYSVPVGSQGTLLIRDILGTILQKQILPAASGKITISTLNMSDGIYFASLLVDGKITLTKKLIVQH